MLVQLARNAGANLKTIGPSQIGESCCIPVLNSSIHLLNIIPISPNGIKLKRPTLSGGQGVTKYNIVHNRNVDFVIIHAAAPAGNGQIVHIAVHLKNDLTAVKKDKLWASRVCRNPNTELSCPVIIRRDGVAKIILHSEGRGIV